MASSGGRARAVGPEWGRRVILPPGPSLARVRVKAESFEGKIYGGDDIMPMENRLTRSCLSGAVT